MLKETSMTKTFTLSESITVILDDNLSPNNLLEQKFWMDILHFLKNELSEKKFNSLNFYLIFGKNNVLVPCNENRTNIIIIADEHQNLRPEIYCNGNIIFQSSYSEKIFAHVYDKIFAFPVGYNKNLNLNSCIPFPDRKINVFFSGNLHRGRKRMFNYYSYLRVLPFFLQHRIQAKLKIIYDNAYPDSYIRFTDGFMRGLDSESYSAFLKNSKIVLTPHGSIAEECFRHYEAIKAGCIIVSERLPRNYFFDNSPIIQIESWEQGDGIIRQLLADPDRMMKLHQDSLKWWKDVMSEAAVARYMKDIITKCIGED